MIIVRHGIEEERAELRGIFAAAVAQAEGYSPAQRQAWLAAGASVEGWAVRHAGKEFWVAEVDDVLAGWIDWRIEGAQALVDMLYVLPQFQRRGVGQRLIGEVVEEARVRKLSRLYTQASFMARGCFAKAGFVGLRENKVARGGETLINYEMELDFNIS